MATRQRIVNKQRTAAVRTAETMNTMGFPVKDFNPEDLGEDGSGYMPRWTTQGLPQTGKDSSVDESEQPTGSGAPATVVPGAPLKTPTEAAEVRRPKLKDGSGYGEPGREATRVLERVAGRIRQLDPALARRILRVASELSVEDISTAALPETGHDDANDDGQETRMNHGKLQFFGTDPAKETSLRKGSRRVAREATPRRADQGPLDDVNWKNTLGMVESALKGGGYDPKAVASILTADYKRTMDKLKGGRSEQPQPVHPASASRKTRSAKLEHTPSPTMQDPEQDAPPTTGTGGFYKDSKAPLKEMTQPGDVTRPKLREAPEASRASSKPRQHRSAWQIFKDTIKKAHGAGVQYNGGEVSLTASDYDQTVELEASATDFESTPHTAGLVSFTLLHDSPRGKYATLEINDDLVEHRSVEQTIKASQAEAYAKKWASRAAAAGKLILSRA